MSIKDWKKDIFTIPNLLSLFRLILIPVYVAIYLHADESTDYYLAAGILAVSCLTDMIDGKIARRFNMMSSFGQLLDPIADKATQFSLIICLTKQYRILWYLVALFTIKESFQLIACCVLYRKGKMLKGALWGGKVCTTVLFISLILMIMLPGLEPNTVQIIFWVDLLFLLIAFADYIVAYLFQPSKFRPVQK